QQRLVLIVILNPRAIRQVSARKDRAESGHSRRRRLIAREKEVDISRRGPDGREDFLRAERSKDIGIGVVDVAETWWDAIRVVGVGTYLELSCVRILKYNPARPGRCIEVEEITGKWVRRRQRCRHSVPINLTAPVGKRDGLVGPQLTEPVAEKIDSGLNRIRIRARGADHRLRECGPFRACNQRRGADDRPKNTPAVLQSCSSATEQ